MFLKGFLDFLAGLFKTTTVLGPLPKGTTKFGIHVHPYQVSAANIALAVSLGVSFVRIEIPWDEVDDGYADNWAVTDAIADQIRATKLKVLWVTGQNNPKYGPMPLTNYLQQFVAFHVAFQTRYADITLGYEVCNEPNNAVFWGGSPDAASYSVVFATCAKALKALCSNLLILGGNTSGVDTQFLALWSTSKGITSDCDYLNVHPYRQTLPPETATVDLNSLSVFKKEVSISEWGYDSDIAPVGHQEQYIPRMVAVAVQANVKLFSLYALQDTIGGDCACGLVTPQGNLKTSFQAYKTAIQQYS